MIKEYLLLSLFFLLKYYYAKRIRNNVCVGTDAQPLWQPCNQEENEDEEKREREKKTLMLKRLLLKSIIAISLPQVESLDVNAIFSCMELILKSV